MLKQSFLLSNIARYFFILKTKKKKKIEMGWDDGELIRCEAVCRDIIELQHLLLFLYIFSHSFTLSPCENVNVFKINKELRTHP